MSSDVTGKRLCLSCRLMIFFLHKKPSGSRPESFELTSVQCELSPIYNSQIKYCQLISEEAAAEIL
jgi:hypothetical protein